MSRIDLHFPNASCAHCVRLVSRSLRRVDGVADIAVDRPSGRVVVDFDPTRISADVIRLVMEQSGYPTRLLSEKLVPFPPQPFSGRAA